MNERSEMLEGIRRAIGSRGSDRESDYASIRRGYHQALPIDLPECVHLFVDRLHDYDATVHFCPVEGIAATVAAVLSGRRKHSLLVPPQLPPDWMPSNFEFIRDTGLSYGHIDRSEGVLTGCAIAIAATGTIVLRHSAGEGRRALTLIPDYHLCVVFEHQIVGTVPEGIRLMSEFGRAPITTISGPSATADIEMTRIKGVHGPRTLDVILVA
ncbi:MAG: LUD domain-containing protein [Acidobacteriaceae bacterium]|nr:LUD domain-containing protein [Acidobacteriaceae bacterium]